MKIFFLFLFLLSYAIIIFGGIGYYTYSSGSCPSQLLQLSPNQDINNHQRLYPGQVRGTASQRIKHKERPSLPNTFLQRLVIYIYMHHWISCIHIHMLFNTVLTKSILGNFFTLWEIDFTLIYLSCNLCNY